MNRGVHVSFCFVLVLSGYMSRSGIPRSCGNFSFLGKLHPVFHSGYTNLPPHTQCNRILFSPHPLQHLLLVDFSTRATVIVVKWYLIVVLISIPLKVLLSIFSFLTQFYSIDLYVYPYAITTFIITVVL